MDEQASFEPQAVLGGRRAGRNRLLVAVPVIAFAAIAWAGLSGPRSDADVTAENVATTAPALAAGPSAESPLPLVQAAGPVYPSQLLGFAVHRLDDVQQADLGRDDITAIAGWYVATAITDCPPLAAIYREGAPQELSGGADYWAFCDRS